MTAEIDYMIIIKSRAGEQKTDHDSCSAQGNRIMKRLDKIGDTGTAIRQ